MKKSISSRSNSYQTLRPIQPSIRDVSFRKMVKFRNQAHGSAAMTPKHQPINTSRHSQHTQSQIITRYSQTNNSIKDFVKGHIKKKAFAESLNPVSTSRTPLKTEMCNQSRISGYSRNGGRASSSSKMQTKTNSFSKLQSSLVFGKNSNLSMDELKRKVQHLLDLNIQRCRLM